MERYKNFKDFYPYYISEHDNKHTKLMHFIGTSLSIYFLIKFFLSFNFLFVLYALYLGMGLLGSATSLLKRTNQLHLNILFIASLATTKCILKYFKVSTKYFKNIKIHTFIIL